MLKKMMSIMFCLSLLLSVGAMAAGAQDNCFEVEIDENTSITVVIPSELDGALSEKELNQLIAGEEFSDGNILTIWEVVEAESEDASSNAPRVPFTYNSTKTKTASSVKASESYFIISCARGETITLAREFSKTMKTIFSTESPFVALGIEASLNAKWTTKYKWEGPVANSSYNSREFRLKFYYDHYKWTQIKTDLGSDREWTTSGIAKVPVKYASYSTDKNI